MRTRMLSAAVVAAIAVASLAGCTAGGGSGGGSMAGPAAADSAGGSASGASGGAVKGLASDRSVVTTGSLQLVADRPIRAADRIGALVEAAGGSIASSSEDPSGRASADLELRIPAAAFRSTLKAIEREGDVRDVAIHATDVTARVTDYGVRIANLRTSIARLQTLLAKADTSAALVEIEGALTERQGALEQLLAEQRTLADQVADATLRVSIVVPAAAPKAGPADFVGGLVAGWAGLVATLTAVTVGAGVLLPWAVLLGLLGVAVALVVRRIRRRPAAA